MLITLISQIENPELKQDYLNKLKKNLIKDENVKKLKSTISFEETLERFNKKKSKYLTVGSQIAAHTLMETGNGPNEPNTINL